MMAKKSACQPAGGTERTKSQLEQKSSNRGLPLILAKRNMFPLFITCSSLSSRTPIGVQTRLFLEEFPDARHLFWEQDEFKFTEPHSTRAESALYSWFTLLKLKLASKRIWNHASQSTTKDSQTVPTLGLPKMGFSWWAGNSVLKPRFETRIVNRYAAKVSVIYAAPLSIHECERMKSILISLGKPFVVHLWDIKDKEQVNSAAFRWLLENAAHVFCLSEAMIDYLHPFRSDATVLRFMRKPSTHSGAPPENGVLRIALLGNQKNYWDGLSVLRDALSILRERKIPAEVVHVGAKNKMRGGLPYLSHKVQMTGFLRSDEDRDRALATCHIGFLSGPLLPPRECNFSRFSIPSRIVDYLAVGLPVVATIHSDSATAIYMRKHGLKEAIVGGSAERTAERLIALRNAHYWRTESEASRRGFASSQQEKGNLKYWLERAAANAQKQESLCTT